MLFIFLHFFILGLIVKLINPHLFTSFFCIFYFFLCFLLSFRVYIVSLFIFQFLSFLVFRYLFIFLFFACSELRHIIHCETSVLISLSIKTFWMNPTLFNTWCTFHFSPNILQYSLFAARSWNWIKGGIWISGIQTPVEVDKWPISFWMGIRKFFIELRQRRYGHWDLVDIKTIRYNKWNNTKR